MNSLDNLVVSCKKEVGFSPPPPLPFLLVGVPFSCHPGKSGTSMRRESSSTSLEWSGCSQLSFLRDRTPEPGAEGRKGLILTFQSQPGRRRGGEPKSADSLPACWLLFPLTDVTVNRPASIIISVSQCTGTRWAPCVCHLVSVHCARLQM